MKKIIALTISLILFVFLGSQLVPAAQQKFPGMEQQQTLRVGNDHDVAYATSNEMPPDAH